MAERVKRLELPVRADPEQPLLLEHAVEVEHARHVSLPVVAHDDEVRPLKVAIAADALHEHAQLRVMLAQLLAGRFTLHAELVAHGVQIAHLHEHHIRLPIIADDFRRNRVGKRIQASVDEVVVAAEQVSVAPEVAVKRILRGYALVELAGIVPLVVHWHTHGQVDVHVCAGGNGPVHQAGAVAMLLRNFGEELLFHQRPARVPRPGIDTGLHHLVVRDAVLVGIAARHDGRMAGIGEGRIDGKDLAHLRTMLEHPPEMRQRAHKFHVRLAERVDHKDKNLLLFHEMPPSESKRAGGLLRQPIQPVVGGKGARVHTLRPDYSDSAAFEVATQVAIASSAGMPPATAIAASCSAVRTA